MPDSIVDFFIKHWPKLTIGLFVVIVIVWGTVYMTKKILHWMGRVNEAHNKCDAVDNRIDNIVMPKLNGMDNTLNTLSTTVTAFGEQILSEAGGKDFVDNNLEILLDEISKNNVKTALDVQTTAPMVISNISNDDKFTSIKDFLYKNPQYKVKPEEESVVSLDMNVITNIMGIYLRNKYLERHPELDPS